MASGCVVVTVCGDCVAIKLWNPASFDLCCSGLPGMNLPREFSGLASHPIYWQDAPSIRPQYKRSSKYYHTHSTIITIDLSHPQDVATVFTLCPPAQGNGVIDGRLSYYGDHTLAHYADAQADHIAA